MDVRQITVQGGVRTRIDTSGRFFMLIETAAPVDVEFIRSRSTFREVGRGVEAGYKSFPDPTRPGEDQGYDGLVFVSGVTQTLTYATSDRAGDYSQIGIRVQQPGPNSTTTEDDVTVSSVAVVVLAADANRKHATVRNIGANNVRLGDAANIGPTRGYQLRAGEYYTHNGEDELAAIREGASDSTLCVIEHARV